MLLCVMCSVLVLFVRYCYDLVFFFFFKQKTAYEMRISDWSSDVCSSDLSCAYSDGFGLAPIAPEQFQSRAPRRAAYSRPEREHPSARLRHDHEAHRHSQTQEAFAEP